MYQRNNTLIFYKIILKLILRRVYIASGDHFLLKSNHIPSRTNPEMFSSEFQVRVTSAKHEHYIQFYFIFLIIFDKSPKSKAKLTKKNERIVSNFIPSCT